MVGFCDSVWFPGADFKRKAFAHGRNAQDLRDTPFEEAKKQLVRKPSLVPVS